MAHGHPSPHRRDGLALFCLSFLTAACGADRNIVAIIDVGAGGSSGNASELHGGGAINPTGGAATSANGGTSDRATTNATGGTPSRATTATNGGTVNSETTSSAFAIESRAGAINDVAGGTTNVTTTSGGTSPANGGMAPLGSVGNATTGGVMTVGGSSGTQDSSRAGGSTVGASGAVQGGATAQQTDFSIAGSNHLGTLIFGTDPGAADPSTDVCFCVPPNSPLLCSPGNTANYPVCEESCASEPPACVGSCPCREPVSDITSEGFDCWNHEECGPSSACLIVEDANTYEPISSHCL